MSTKARKRGRTAPDKPVDTSLGLPAIMPKEPRLQKFCEAYVKYGSAAQAAREAGYSEKWAKDYAWDALRKYGDYIKWLQAHYAQEASKRIAIELEPVLQEMALIAFANPRDYLVFEPAEEPDKPPKVRMKRLDELTREQMRAIKLIEGPDGTLTYELRDPEPQLVNLARHLGAFNEKIIFEHRHRHLHAHLDLSKASDAQLEALEAQFEELLTQSGHGRLLEAS